MHASGFTDQGSTAPDRLIAGEYPRIAEKVTLTGDAALARGALLGRVTASGSYALSEAAGDDGSEDPVAILAHDADPSDDDVEVLVYRTGEFNEAAVIYGAGHDADSVRDDLAALQIWLRRTIPA